MSKYSAAFMLLHYRFFLYLNMLKLLNLCQSKASCVESLERQGIECPRTSRHCVPSYVKALNVFERQGIECPRTSSHWVPSNIKAFSVLERLERSRNSFIQDNFENEIKANWKFSKLSQKVFIFFNFKELLIFLADAEYLYPKRSMIFLTIVILF